MYDMKNLSKIKKLEEHAPKIFETFFAFDKAAMAPGTVPAKYKELVAVAVALTTQCSYCIQVHVGRAREAGVGDAELAEIAAVAATIRAGGSDHTRDAPLLAFSVCCSKPACGLAFY